MISRTLLLSLAAAGLFTAVAALPAGCANSAADCALLGLSDGCNAGATSSSGTGGTGGTGGTTSSSSSTGVSTGGAGGAGGATSSSSGTGGSPPVVTTLPLCGQKKWGDAEAQAVRGVVVDPLGIVIAGDFQGKIDIGQGPLTAAAGGLTFVARLDASLGSTWSRSFDAKYLAMAADTTGNVIIAGQLTAPTDFGCNKTLDPANGALFALKLDTTGACVFSESYKVDAARVSVAADPGGFIVLAGSATGTIDFSPLPAHAPAGGTDIFVTKLSTAGAPLVMRAFGSAGDDDVAGVSVDASGKIFFAGTYAGTLDFGSGDGTFDSKGKVGAYAASLTAAFGASWSRAFTSANDISVSGAVPASVGGLVIAGTFTGSLDAGGSTALKSDPGGLYLVQLDASGNPADQHAFDGFQAGEISAVAAGLSGDVAVAGSHQGGVYLARFKAGGMLAYDGAATGTGADHRATAAAFLDANTVLLGGFFDGTLSTVGMSSIATAGADDALLLKVCLP
ncbi:MAG: hypothetical protein QM820_31995 [Minicystis sp.]